MALIQLLAVKQNIRYPERHVIFLDSNIHNFHILYTSLLPQWPVYHGCSAEYLLMVHGELASHRMVVPPYFQLTNGIKKTAKSTYRFPGPAEVNGLFT